MTEPHEIDLVGLCSICDVTVKERPLKGCEARIVGWDEKAVVTLTVDLHEARRRFCIGHELGHWMHDRGTPVFSCSSTDIGHADPIQRPVEARANQYAADLLMPKKMFLKEARKFDVDFNAVRKLADMFRTSINATAIRLVTTGDLPAAFICTTREGKQRYAVRGGDLPGSIRINKKINPESYASELIRTRKLHQCSKPVPADYWVSANNAYDHEIYEHSVRGFDGEVWTLLWWKDEEMLEELE